MSDTLSDEDLKRLHDLAALRDRGVLSEEEFQRAKARLLGPGGVAEPPPSSGMRRFGLPYPHWLFALAGFLVLLIVLWLVWGSQRSSQDSLAGNGLTVNLTEPQIGGPELCTSDAIFGQLKNMVFDRAIDQYDGDPGPLNSLRRVAGVRMEYPTLREVNQDIERSDCAGRLIIDIPPDAQQHFGGATAIQADVQYSIQPGPDGAGIVVEAGGADYVVQRLVAAANMLDATRAAAEGGPQLQKTYNPSFDCGRRLSNVERMICQDEQLSELDRALAGRYVRLEEALPPLDWRDVIERRRQFLARRAECPDVECVKALYVEQNEYLDRLDEGPLAADAAP